MQIAKFDPFALFRMRTSPRAHLWDLSSIILKEPLVFVVLTDPEPQLRIAVECRERAVVIIHPRRPQVVPDALEVQRAMLRVLAPEGELFVRRPSDVGRQRVVKPPKPAERPALHGNGRDWPSRCSRVASSMN